uniref:iron-sulfur cluster formation ABC transporter ATP-binding subunit n=1 Tax=Madagascaria erythrocladioides TaxID=753684 RepID=UPI001BF11182|nr:iron-sulfur cluster formation ABC transporter ATP-binding subunit [Madagascaria erythrocladioides]QUE28976.1 SufC [Madagascaria erythrocladioides]UNJ16527.1 iron-sulfur cluster formation ABC transporter ATP-binding subunit [Madagascaria erythrocladioides]
MIINHDILSITNLQAEVADTSVINGLDLKVKAGEIHAIMGPNGSGKSSLSKIVAGHPAYTVTKGEIVFENQNILDVEAHLRSQKGIFLSFQYPVEIPGVSNADFLRLSYNERRKNRGEAELDPLQFFEFVSSKLESIGMDSSFLSRNVNEGFSGGEKKKNEILQMSLLDAKLAILDETDSGLDIDALKTIATSIKKLSNSGNAIILITHYQRLLNYIEPNFVHVMKKGKIVKTGTSELAYELEQNGYEWIKEGE